MYIQSDLFRDTKDGEELTKKLTLDQAIELSLKSLMN